MKKIPNEKIEEIRKANELSEVISEHINIQKQGKNFVAICPFHSDTSPSLNISKDKQIFKCFSCGAGGNVISFLQRYKNITFLETLKELAQRANIDSSEITIVKKIINYSDEVLKIFEINEEILNFFKYNIQNELEDIKDYLKKRALDQKQIDIFDIGYVNKVSPIVTFLQKKGFSDSDIIKAGLATLKDDGKVRSFFFNRLMFPIRDYENNIVGFSGRIIFGEGGPKYLNSPETKAFKKSEILFNINKLKNNISSSKEVYIVEGHMDVVTLSKIGIVNVVALMGTSISEKNIRKLSTITKKIILLLDNDSPGKKATIEISKKFMKNDIFVEVSSIENEFKDIDELINSGYDNEKIKKEIGKTITPMEFLIKHLKENLDLSSPINKKTFLFEIKKMMELEQEEIYIETYINEVSKLLNLSIEIIKKEVLSEMRKEEIQKIEHHYNEDQQIIETKDHIEKLMKFYSEIETNILKQSINNYQCFKAVKEHDFKDWWRNKNRILFMYLEKYYENNNRMNYPEFLDSVRDEIIQDYLIEITSIESNSIKIWTKEESIEWIEKCDEAKDYKELLVNIKVKNNHKK